MSGRAGQPSREADYLERIDSRYHHLLALCGFVSKTRFSHRVDGVAIWIYVLLGWMPPNAILPPVDLNSPDARIILPLRQGVQEVEDARGQRLGDHHPSPGVRVFGACGSLMGSQIPSI